MLQSSISSLKSKLASALRFGPARESFHGLGVHGFGEQGENLYQPQDGVAKRRRVVEIGTDVRRAGEPEDARLTGGTRSLMRRLSGLNVIAARPPRPVSGPSAKAA